jgi:hypothetical protein
MPKQTWYQKEKAAERERTREKAHHGHGGPTTAAPAVKSDIPNWLEELIAVLEAIWGSLSASESEPNHPAKIALDKFKHSAHEAFKQSK